MGGLVLDRIERSDAPEVWMSPPSPEPESTELLSVEDLQDAWNLLVSSDRIESFRALDRTEAFRRLAAAGLSTVELWAARDGKPSQKLIDWRPGTGGYAPLERGPDSDDQRLAKVSLMPYFTDKDPTQAHPLGQVWYGPTIISTQRIADPL